MESIIFLSSYFDFIHFNKLKLIVLNMTKLRHPERRHGHSREEVEGKQ
jgi:hypothetical protein